ncbi:DNA-directed RNA polymerase III complex subunit Rpc25 [Malassezia vespertilionis]|uniref:DNA-directed RNA polymerase III complex subunit Rpc25 n=1 Tax=Malassezia vespertilionis TaxID=2020962 RepID=UPI0024B155A7|nr:DNA-directed RNA polymerase III complex subunit Rpc25 [Malassezia vespertilionis]WFD08187.1 DNA-directed RNA polymerase III complex subunit Rpc25 [Malassezia vespertilionis]
MFMLSEIEDTIHVEPKQFAMPSADALVDQIKAKYANRILQDVGLCICVNDILDASEGRVRWGDGFLYYTVRFRLVIFRPFTNEVLVGRISSSSSESIRVTMGFFDDIYIPPHLLPYPAAFDYQEQAWFWLLDPASEAHKADPLLSAPDERMYLDMGDTIRFAIESDSFVDVEPGPAAAEGKPTATHSAAGAQNRFP